MERRCAEAAASRGSVFRSLIAYTIYGVKVGPGAEFWPYRGWGYQALLVFRPRPWASGTPSPTRCVMTVFGIRAMKRWGFDRDDKFQIWRYMSLLGFQWIFFFLIPEFLFQYAVKYEWVGALAGERPHFANAAWRSYGLVYAWPLFFYTFFDAPHQIWIVWGALLSFVIIPVAGALPRQALLLVDLRLRRPRRNAGRPLAAPRAQGHAASSGSG